MLASNYFAVLACDVDKARASSTDSSNTMPSATDSEATTDFSRDAREMLLNHVSDETPQAGSNWLGLYSAAANLEAPFSSSPVGSFLQTTFDPRLRQTPTGPEPPREVIPARLGTPVPDRAAGGALGLPPTPFEDLTAEDHHTAWNTQVNRDFNLQFDEVKAFCLHWFDTPSFLSMRDRGRRNARMPVWALRHHSALKLGRIITVNAGNVCGLDYKFEVLGPDGGAIWLRDEMVDIFPGMQEEVDRFWDAGFALRNDLAERLLYWRPARYSSAWWTMSLTEWFYETAWTTHVYLRGPGGMITNVWGPCYNYY